MINSTGFHAFLTPSGTEVLDHRAALSNLGVSVNMADSVRVAASHQAQTSRTTAMHQTENAGQQYVTALRILLDVSDYQQQNSSSGQSIHLTARSGFVKAASDVSQLATSFAKEHGVSTAVATQVMGQLYAEGKVGSGFILRSNLGESGRLSRSYSQSQDELYPTAQRFMRDHHMTEAIDLAQRTAQESHYRTGSEKGDRLAKSLASSG